MKSGPFWKKNAIGIEEQDKNKWLDGIAVDVVEDLDVNSYTIILNDDQPIKSGSLLMSRDINVAADGSTFDVKDAHRQMVKYYHDLQKEPQDEFKS